METNAVVRSGMCALAVGGLTLTLATPVRAQAEPQNVTAPPQVVAPPPVIDYGAVPMMIEIVPNGTSEPDLRIYVDRYAENQAIAENAPRGQALPASGRTVVAMDGAAENRDYYARTSEVTRDTVIMGNVDGYGVEPNPPPAQEVVRETTIAQLVVPDNSGPVVYERRGNRWSLQRSDAGEPDRTPDVPGDNTGGYAWMTVAPGPRRLAEQSGMFVRIERRAPEHTPVHLAIKRTRRPIY